LFLQVVKAPWAQAFLWEEWKAPQLNFASEIDYFARPGVDLHTSETPVRFRDTLEGLKVREQFSAELRSLREEIRRRNYSIRTEHAYETWVMRYLTFHDCQEPRHLDTSKLKAYLSYLANTREVAASTQNQALSAVIFFYDQVLKKPLGNLEGFVRAKRPMRLPVVLVREETARLFAHLTGVHHLMAGLLYGAGLRLMECIRLRVQDVDFQSRQITVRDAKGLKDRVSMLPEKFAGALQEHLEKVRKLYEQDRAANVGGVYLPTALARKYPQASTAWGWQYIFPATKLSVDPRSTSVRRHHIHESVLQRAIKAAATRAGIAKKVNCHALRHTFATDLLRANYDIRTVQELLGHADVSTTMIYTHVLNRPGLVVKSPADL
jgi:integron integrase